MIIGYRIVNSQSKRLIGYNWLINYHYILPLIASTLLYFGVSNEYKLDIIMTNNGEILKSIYLMLL